MEGLPSNTKETLIKFRDTPYFKAYQEYVLLQSGKCLGMFRNKALSHEENMYWKGVMTGIEMFWMDTLNRRIEEGQDEKANHDNREHTEKLIRQGIENETKE